MTNKANCRQQIGNQFLEVKEIAAWFPDLNFGFLGLRQTQAQHNKRERGGGRRAHYISGRGTTGARTRLKILKISMLWPTVFITPENRYPKRNTCFTLFAAPFRLGTDVTFCETSFRNGWCLFCHNHTVPPRDGPWVGLGSWELGGWDPRIQFRVVFFLRERSALRYYNSRELNRKTSKYHVRDQSGQLWHINRTTGVVNKKNVNCKRKIRQQTQLGGISDFQTIYREIRRKRVVHATKWNCWHVTPNPRTKSEAKEISGAMTTIRTIQNQPFARKLLRRK